ncbi:UDP-N-acetyl-D-mannosamine dehydrogenase [Corynebacterium mendelii]|uniref:UDP-N-acetyl-D-mannosamine dehydrogenase n=1 Tax=Corynebacterium mendelii TaxID=2765362 RepID=A0A939E2J7_9CORY|nr:UDP-N-acetyl-D-mannosamine dehydrogenase [Corynebacterium mendelii]MBN9645300.1 UDP-N-acetyl-D-mannosamine dehydrogenase [Corynebacterium mendelii]
MSETQSPAEETITVVGLGYIGLPTAVVLVNSGFTVHGVDISPRTVDAVKTKKLPFHEPNLQTMLETAVDSGRLSVSGEVDSSDIYIIAVPTPALADHSPDLTAVNAAVDAIMPELSGGELVIIESTIPPGTVQSVSERIRAGRPDLDGGSAKPVLFAHVPERVLPGKIMQEIRENNRIIGGLTPEATDKAMGVYSRFCSGKIYQTDATTAELCKLAENSFRDVNIAFANELSMICDGLGTNVWELIRLANMHPRVNILKPGVGVGGHCIAVDPWFIVAADESNSRLIKTAREVNDSKPFWVTERILDELDKHRTATVIVLGLTFKPDVDDVREAPAVTIVEALARSTAVDHILVVDPNLSALPPRLRDLPAVELRDLDDALAHDGVICLAVAHREFMSLPLHQLAGRGLVDACGLNNPTG